MDKVVASKSQDRGERRNHVLTWLLSEPAVCLLAALGVGVGLFYLEENWRGHRAWLKCKQGLESKGAVLDWSAHIPPAVPEDQNFFSAPNMAQWFVNRGQNLLTQRLNPGSLFGFTQQTSSILAELTVVAAYAPIIPGEADLVVQYNPSLLTSPIGLEDASDDSTAHDVPIPLIVMDDVPLADAIRNLARQANLNYLLDPTIGFGTAGAQGKPSPHSTVSFRWENVTALQALVAMLNNYSLQLIEDPKSGISRITAKKAEDSAVFVEPALRRRLAKIVQDGLLPEGRGSNLTVLKGVQGFDLVARPPDTRPATRITVRANTAPRPEELASSLTTSARSFPTSSRVQVVPTGTNHFRAFFGPPPYLPASEYLAWSDQFEEEFNQVRQALRRPYAQMPGDYRDPVAMPIPNFVAIRMLAQTLAQRAQCYLLLDQPEPALRELALIHDLCGLLESKPGGKPMTLVAAMIHVAVSGLYVGVVADGLRLQSWREPELAAIQAQLAQVNLAPFVANSCGEERAAACRILETTTGTKFAKLFSSSPAPASLLDRLKDPTYLFLTFAPRGWVYQNMCVVASLEEDATAGFDASRQLIVPHTLDQTSRETQAALDHFSPLTFLAGMTIPNYTRAWQTLARNQTLANEGRVACALERYRLAEGQYPTKLAELVPRFADALPHDLINGWPLHYRRTNDGRFLLYSVGWNEQDDGGVPGDRDTGDWVWQAPTG
jgi:hypothetical protein